MSSLNSVCYSGRRRLRLAAPLKLREKMDTSPALSVSAQPSLAAWKSRIKQWSTSDMESHEERVLLILTLIIGALVGLVIAAFIYVTENLAARMYPTGGGSWRVLVIPTAGALLTGYLLSRYFPNARGSGIPQTKAACSCGTVSSRSGRSSASSHAPQSRWQAGSRWDAKDRRFISEPGWHRFWGGGWDSAPNASAI